MDPTSHSVETAAAVAAKIAPPVSVSLATLFGYQVNELVLLSTFVYTVLLILHKVYTMIHDVAGRQRRKPGFSERRVGDPDPRAEPTERRAHARRWGEL